MRLNHLHISGIIPFARASQIQNALVSQFMDYKRAMDSISKSETPSASQSQDTTILSQSGKQCPPRPPNPTILTFVPEPVYTTGRRDMPPDYNANGSAAPDNVQLPSVLDSIRPLLNHSPPLATWYPTLRGGQTTYHGPGQVVIYTIMDLKAMRLGPRTHIRALERSVMNLLSRLGIKSMRTEDPGVWVPLHEGGSSVMAGDATAATTTSTTTTICEEEEGTSDCYPPTPANARKLAAVGVHLRRFISSYGVGLNVTNQPLWYFSQIVPCGLVNKEATSLENEGVEVLAGLDSINAESVEVADTRDNGGEKTVYKSAEKVIAEMFVTEFVKIVNKNFGHGDAGRSSTAGGIAEVVSVEEKDLLP
ncbi:hypothetical protein KEM54_006274 [Ascosphaera aggregata]|nr:hypothetical protein KEM54_006274 [Ascosphaera aggregata]